MGLIGSGDGSSYPGNLDQTETRAFGDLYTPEFANDIQEVAVSCQPVLGTNPQGTFASVVLRLDNIDSRIMLASGTASIVSTDTDVVITHNLGVVPLASAITIHPTNNPTNDPGMMWIDSLTTTTFRVNFRNQPGATLNLAWQVAILTPA